MVRMQIRSKVAIMVTLWVFCLSMLGLYSIRISSSSLEQSYGQNMVNIANVMHGTMATIILNKIETLQNIDTRPVIVEPLHSSNCKFSGMADREAFILQNNLLWREFMVPSEKRPHSPIKALPPPLKDILINETVSILKGMFFSFYERHQGRTVFSKLCLTNAFGVNIASTSVANNYYVGDKEWWKSAVKNGVYLSDIHHETSDSASSELASDEYGLTIAVRLNDQENNFLGVVKAVLSSRWIMREVQAVTERNDYTDVKLVTHDGKLIYSNKVIGRK